MKSHRLSSDIQEEHLINVCKLGQGKRTCYHIGIRKDHALGSIIRACRKGEIRRDDDLSEFAQGDNCTGAPDFIPLVELKRKAS